MSSQVAHEKRKQEILEKALDVFVEEGYADTLSLFRQQKTDLQREY